MKLDQLKGASLEVISNAIARPIAIDPYEAQGMYNESVYVNEGLVPGVGSPYIGIAGQPTFVQEQGSGVVKVRFYPIRIAPSTTTGAPAIASGALPFPGNGSTASIQYIKITGSAAESETATVPNLSAAFAVGDKVFFRDEDKIFFPGEVISAHRYDNASNEYEPWDSGDSDQTDSIILGVSPGLPFVPEPYTTSDSHVRVCWGTVTTPAESGDGAPLLIKKVTVKRRKLRSLDG